MMWIHHEHLNPSITPDKDPRMIDVPDILFGRYQAMASVESPRAEKLRTDHNIPGLIDEPNFAACGNGFVCLASAHVHLR